MPYGARTISLPTSVIYSIHGCRKQNSGGVEAVRKAKYYENYVVIDTLCMCMFFQHAYISFY